MTTIVVTHSDPDALGDAGSAESLTLHTCSTCGGHVWERDGTPLDRAEVLGVVRDRIGAKPARVPQPRRRRQVVLPVTVAVAETAPAGSVPEQGDERTREIRALLSGFTVQGSETR